MLIYALLVLQLFVVLFLALHDWVPLGRLNDVKAAQAADPPAKLIVTTIASAAPFAAGLAVSLYYFGRPYPFLLIAWLWLSYFGLLMGQIRAWWIPYFVAEPARAARYEKMFANTHAFVPARNGIRPNTMHLILTAAILAVLIILATQNLG